MNIHLPSPQRAAQVALSGALLVLALFALFLGGPAHAEQDPPGRVGRLADFHGPVSWWDDETGQWADAQRNRPLTGGDRIATAGRGRAELRVGSTVLRLANDTEVEVLRLDDERMVFQLHSGSLALRVHAREVADEIGIVTAEAYLLPQRAGHYRIDRQDDRTQAGTWRGALRVTDDSGLLIGDGQRAELFRTARRDGAGGLRHAWITMPDDEFTSWVMAEDSREDRGASARYVSPEMTGAEDLDRHGRWEQHPEYGALWLPLEVRAGWAPYRYGRWDWVAPWGWTWIDDAPWGFAPFHYGRWVSWRGRWGWVPGALVPRPVYAPALVAWIGGGNWGVSVQVGGPNVGWVPLAPREVYRPHYRTTPRYIERVNPVPPYRWRHPPGHVPTGPISYGNQGVPNAVTVVPRDVLSRHQPVARGVVELPRGNARAPLAVLPPPAAPARRPPAERAPPREPIGAVHPVPGGGMRQPPAPAPVPEVRPSRGPLSPSRDDRRDDRADPRPVPRAEGRPDPRPAPHAEERRDDRREDRREERREDRRDRPEDRRRDDRADERREVIDLRQGRPGPATPARAPSPAPAPQGAPAPAPAVVPAPAPAPQPIPSLRGPRPVAPPPAAAAPSPRPAPQPQPQPAVAPPAPAPAAAPAPPAPPPERAQPPERARPRGDRDRDRDGQR